MSSYEFTSSFVTPVDCPQSLPPLFSNFVFRKWGLVSSQSLEGDRKEAYRREGTHSYLISITRHETDLADAFCSSLIYTRNVYVAIFV